MYFMSHCAGWGRNFWESIHNGTIHIYEGRDRTTVEIQGGVVVERMSQKKDECTTLRYGHGLTTKKANKTVKQVYYEPNTLQAIRKGGLWKKETGIQLCGSDGTIECYSTSSGAYGREIFTYRNGRVGYIASRWRKKLVVYRPNGKLWIVIEGKVHLNYTPVAERLSRDDDEVPLWALMRPQNWALTVYRKDGKTIHTRGKVENRQKTGKWLEAGKDKYYLSGVKVSRKLFEDEPEKWNPAEVLGIQNSQLRCSLLNRMGYDRLLSKVDHKIIDSLDDGQQLVEISTGVEENRYTGPDRIMRLIKVVCPSTSQIYVLRVPPTIGNFEQARQWTFGLQERSINNGVQLKLMKET